MRFALGTVKVMDDYVANPCYLLLLITGVGMVHVAGYPWKLMWIHGSLALLVIIAVLGFGFYTPTLRKQIAVLESRGSSDPEFARLGTRGAILGGIMALMVMVDRRADGLQAFVGSGSVGRMDTSTAGVEMDRRIRHHGIRRVGARPRGGPLAAQTPTAPQKRTFKLKLRAAHRHVRELRRQGSARSDPVHGRRGLPRLRRQRDDEAAGRAAAADGRPAREARHDDGRVRHRWGRQLESVADDGKQEFIDTFVKACRESVDVARRVNAKWMTVVPGYYERNLPIGIQWGHVIDAIRKGAQVLEPHGLVMVLEPLSDNPDLFLRTPDEGFALCRAVNSPACKVLLRHVSRPAQPGPHDRAHRLGVGRDRLLPDRRRAGPQRAGHGRDELPQHLQAHRREGTGLGQGFRAGHGTRQPSCRGPTASASSSRPTSPPTASERRIMAG